MRFMFRDATLFNSDISTWDVAGVTDMSYMFYNAQAFDVDLSLWDVNSVTSMPGMFDFTGFQIATNAIFTMCGARSPPDRVRFSLELV